MAEKQLGFAPTDPLDIATKEYVDNAKTAFSATVGDGTSTSILVTHNLRTMDVVVSLHRLPSGEEVEADVVKTSANTITLTFATAPAANSLRCVIVGTAFGAGTPAPANSSSITDATVIGRAVLTATTAAQAQAALDLTGFLAARRSTQTVTEVASLDSVAGKDYVVFVGSGGAPVLPTAVGNTSKYTIKNIHSAARTVSTTSSQTIDGLTSLTLLAGQSVDLLSDGTGWRII